MVILLNMKINMKIKHVLIMASLAVILALTCAPSVRASEAITKQAEIEANYFFPLIAYLRVPSDTEFDSFFKKVREGGINMAYAVPPENVDACRRAGLKAIISHGGVMQRPDANLVTRSVSESLEKIGRNDAPYRFIVWDEPGSKQFSDVDLVCKAVKAAGGVPFVNLLPTYAGLDGLSYEQYLEQFVAAVHPTELCYDHYCLMEDEEQFGASRRSLYWENLESVRKVSKKHGLPFWQVVLTEAHLPYREPDAADMRFQIFTSLAYGARGLGYYLYNAEKSNNGRGAPLDQFGDTTPLYGILRNLNLQVARLAPILLQLTSDDVYHVGEVPKSGHGPGEQNLLTDIEGGEWTGKGSFLVGEFTHRDGSRYLMVVNKNPKKSLPCKLKFRKEPKSVQVCNPYRFAAADKLTVGELRPAVEFWLAPGQGTLLRVESPSEK